MEQRLSNHLSARAKQRALLKFPQSSYLSTVFRDAVRRPRFLELDALLESRVAVPRVTPRPQPPGTDLWVHLLHDLAEVGRGEGLQTVVIAVFSEKKR